MSGHDVDLNYENLLALAEGIAAILTEFSDAATAAEAAEGDIGRPHDRGSLKNAVEDFEENWNDNREKIAENLQAVHDHLMNVIDGFRETDVALAAPSDAPAS
jgi:hypothetical protein